MDRRDFFRHLGRKATVTAIEQAEQHVEQKASHWIRPPYAIAELEFLMACTRCGKCTEACPYNVIFPLPARRGGEVVNTPALDLLSRGCHLCEDWPCVNVCGPGALQHPDETDEMPPRPKIAKVVIDTSICLPYLGPDCGACETSCPVPDALQWKEFKPSINTEKCTGCALCREACIVEPKAISVLSIYSR